MQGLDSLVHLETLALAGNPITEFKVRRSHLRTVSQLVPTLTLVLCR